MIRIKKFFNWLLMGSAMTSGDRNLQIAAHGANLAPDGGSSWKTRYITPEPFNMTSPDDGTVLKGDGGTVYTEQTGITETPEERSRRLKRERDRRYKAKKKAKTTVGLVDAYA